MSRKTLKSLALCLMLGIAFVALSTRTTADVAAASARTASTSVTMNIVNANGGVYWRSAPDWNTPVQKSGFGVYTGEQVAIGCFAWGTLTPYSSVNKLWYQASDVTGPGYGSGYVSDHFVATSWSDPNHPIPGVPQCGSSSPPPTYINGVNVGYPQNAQHWWGSCLVRDYNGGPYGWVIVSYTGGVNIVRNGMLFGWFDNGGAPGRLGCPNNWEHSYMNGVRQDFQHGSLYWVSGMNHAAAIDFSREGALRWAWNCLPDGACNYGGARNYAGYCLAFDFNAYAAIGVNLRNQVGVPINGNTYPQDIWGHFTHGTTGTGTPPRGALVFFLAKSGYSRIYSHVELSLGGGAMLSTADTVNESRIHVETLSQHASSGAWNSYVGWWLPAA